MSRRSRLLLGAAAAVAVGAGAYAVHRVGTSYDRDNPYAGWTRFVQTVKAGAAERERDLRDALGLDAGMPAPTGPGDGRTPPRSTRLPVTSEPLTPEQAKALLLDPAGPRPDRVAEEGD